MWSRYSAPLALCLLCATLAGHALVVRAVSDSCCDELGFPNEAGTPEVCTQTDLPGTGCTMEATWKQARNICKDLGARLCRRRELKAREAREESACDWPRGTLVWVRNRCDGDREVRQAARLWNGRRQVCLPSNDEEATAAVVCCADACAATDCSTAQTATYSVTFTSEWDEGAAVGNEHFTRFVGYAHDGSDEGRHWNSTFMATPGVEGLAELGSTGTIMSELRDKEEQGVVFGPDTKLSVDPSPGSATWTTTVTRTFPWASHLSMIAPSPDWFVGNHQNLLGDDGAWITSTSTTIGQYDAGTEEGENFSLSNDATDPQEPISTLTIPLTNGPGTISFELESCD